MKTFFCALALCATACGSTSSYKPAMAGVDGEHHVVVRAEAGRLWWAHRAWTEPHQLCALPTNGPVENLMVTAGADGFVVSFDQGGATWSGSFGPATSETTQPASKLVARQGSER